MMDIPIDNQNTPQPAILRSMRGGNGNIVEQAKTHRSGWRRVMSRRSNQANCLVVFSAQDLIHSGRCASRSISSDIVRRGAHPCVAINLSAAGFVHLLQASHVFC